MARVLYSAAVSLDGFIAGPGGDMSWLADHLGPDDVADRLPALVGAILAGARTWYGDDPNRGTPREGPFGGAWHGTQVVLTHTPPAHPQPDVTFATDLPSALAAAEAAAGDRYVAVLGADVARQCLAAGRVDEVLVFDVPVLLGDGVRLFERPGGAGIGLERIDPVPAEHTTARWYAVRR